ncbi:MAG: hypothetical protein IMF09_10255 [Proteobacteria bacterium]|nr:hypothetical protein [Pseudomonadota bacterium]
MPTLRFMKIFTSIAPRKLAPGEVDRQQLAVESWLKAGFEPVSLNCAEECEQLLAVFPQVEFRQVDRDARKEVGKPLIYIDDLLAAVASTDGPVSGIVNSDIIFRNQGDLPAELSRITAGGLVYGCRLDVEAVTDKQGKIYDIGFDFFFLDKQAASLYPSSKLCMGAPMWDYWMPLISSKLQRPTRFLRNIIAWHVIHEQAWSQQVNLRMLGELVRQSGMDFGTLARTDFEQLDERGISALREFAQYILPYLYQQSQMIEIRV